MPRRVYSAAPVRGAPKLLSHVTRGLGLMHNGHEGIPLMRGSLTAPGPGRTRHVASRRVDRPTTDVVAGYATS
jgi:hypothetical protein